MKNRGFSLVELSIVLVILGLLTGGILTGQTLIRASELRAVTTEFQRYQSATSTFRDKYFALPGDMRNATDFWTEQAAGAACKTASSTGLATCDGDGNGRIENTPTNSNEYFRYWQHLANAGLIAGTYTGVAGPANANDSVIGENSPASKLSSGGWVSYYLGSVTGHALVFDGDYGNALTMGADLAAGATVAPVLTPEEAWNIDTKMDDGIPALGTVFSTKSTAPLSPNCTSLDTIDAAYNLTNPAILCNIGWRGLN